MGVAKTDGDTAAKAKAVSAVNGGFRLCMDHGSSGKVGTDSRAVGDNRQQWQWQSGNNQLKVMVASGGVDSRAEGGMQQQLLVIGSKMPMAKGIDIAPPTPLSSAAAGGGGWAAAAAARE